MDYMYKIPLFDLNYDKEEEEAILKTIRSKWISMGPNVKQLEEKFARRLNAKHTVAVSNCTAALHLALKILEIKEGDVVIVPSLTFVATINAIRYTNANPVFADITSYEDFSIDPADIEKKITPKTKVIIIMHYGGFSCDMDKIMEIAKKHNLFVVEDAVKMTIKACENKNTNNEIFYIGNSEEEIRIKELAKKISNIMNKEIKVKELPETQGSTKRRCPDISKIISYIDYYPTTSLNEGISKTFHWYENKLNEIYE